MKYTFLICAMLILAFTSCQERNSGAGDRYIHYTCEDTGMGVNIQALLELVGNQKRQLDSLRGWLTKDSNRYFLISYDLHDESTNNHGQAERTMATSGAFPTRGSIVREVAKWHHINGCWPKDVGVIITNIYEFSNAEDFFSYRSDSGPVPKCKSTKRPKINFGYGDITTSTSSDSALILYNDSTHKWISL